VLPSNEVRGQQNHVTRNPPISDVQKLQTTSRSSAVFIIIIIIIVINDVIANISFSSSARISHLILDIESLNILRTILICYADKQEVVPPSPPSDRKHFRHVGTSKLANCVTLSILAEKLYTGNDNNERQCA